MVEEKGFKKTEIGAIPEDWTIQKLSSFAILINGRAFKQHELQKRGKYEVLRVGNFFTNNTWYYSDLELPTDLYVDFGDLMYAWSASFGPQFWKGSKCIYHYHIWKVLVRKNADKYFLYHLFDFDKTKLLSQTQGGTMFHLTKSGMENRSFILPPLPEQTAIATALSDMDELIAQTEKLIEKKKAIKQGVMQELFKPKEGWVEKELGEIGEITGSGVDKKINENEIPVRLVNYMDVYRRDFIYSSELSHWVTAPVLKKENCKVKQGDIFFTPSSETRTDIALAAVAIENIDDAVYSYHLVRFRINEDWDLKFKAYVFSTKLFLQQAESLCEGGGKRYVLTLPKFRTLKVCYPNSKEEQVVIAQILWDVDCQIWNYEKKLQKLKHQKQGMIQALLTGKIRLI